VLVVTSKSSIQERKVFIFNLRETSRELSIKIALEENAA